MKTRFRFMALGVLFAGTTMAQAPRPFGVVTSNTPPDPTTIVQSQAARLTALLTLTTAQAGQATAIFTNALTAITPLQTTLTTDWQSMQTAVTSNSTSTIDQLALSIGSLNGQIIDIQNKADAAFYAILNSTQQTTLTQSGGVGGQGGPGGPGGYGPGPGGPPPGNH